MADIVPGGIPSAEAHGSSKSKGVIRSWKPTNWRLEEQGAPRPIIAPVSILSGEQFGSLEFAYKIKNAGAMASAEAFGSTIVHLSTTIYAASPSLADVQSAIASADSGDTVRVPAGSATWTGRLTKKQGVSVKGAGKGLTNITLTGSGQVYINEPEGYQWSFGGFSFETYVSGIYPIYVLGGTKGFRIHHIYLENPRLTGVNEVGYAGIWFGAPDATDYQWGVVDNCDFVNCREVILDGWLGGHNSYKRSLDLGGADAIYFEDCTFNHNWFHSVFVDDQYGGRYVIRYSAVTNSAGLAHSLQIASPYFPSGFGRGSRKSEYYNNSFVSANNGYDANWLAINIRAGTGVVFNNTVQNVSGPQYSMFLGIDNDRSNWSLPDPLLQAEGGNIIDGNTAVATGTGTHTGSNGSSVLTDGTKSWTTSQFVYHAGGQNRINGHYVYNLTDGSKGLVTANAGTTVTAALAGGTRNNWNTGDSYKITDGWPALDQIGMSTDYGAGANFQPQTSSPLCCWSNLQNFSGSWVDAPVTIINSCDQYILPDRDYYKDTASFNGTSGIGVGLLSARPNSGLTVGVFYWATDTQTLYRATGATTWIVHYQPYTYPHPLRSILGV